MQVFKGQDKPLYLILLKKKENEALLLFAA